MGIPNIKFADISRNEWLSKIEKDLRGHPLDSLNWSMLPNLEISPFAHAKEDHLESLDLQELAPLTNTSSIIEIHVYDLNKANREALRYISLGVGAILFRTKSLLSEEDQQILLYQINKDWVQIFLYPSVHSISIQNPEDFVATSIDFLTNNLSDLSANQSITIEVKTGPIFYLNLCGIRALRLILFQMSEDLKLTFRTNIIAWYENNGTHDDATQLLRSMPSYLASIIGGADFSGPCGKMSDYLSRLQLNNINLLSLESGIPQDKDTVSGSYYLDNLTYQLADYIWSEFLKKI